MFPNFSSTQAAQLWHHQQQQQQQQQQQLHGRAIQQNQHPYPQQFGGGYANGLMAHQLQQSNHNSHLMQQQIMSNSHNTFLTPDCNRSTSNGIGMGPPPGGGGLMLPPTSTGRYGRAHGSGTAEQRLEERKQAAMLRRQEQQEREQREKAEQNSVNLFDRPEKVQSDDSAVASVLGDYSDAKRIINSRSSCIGIDYLPPTPAPVQHVIGGEDDEPVETNAHSVNGNASDSDPNRPHKRPASFPRPQNTQRLPDNINQPHRPQAKPSRPTPDLFPPHASNGFANMALAPAPGNHHKTSRMPNQPNQPSPNWSRAMGTSPGGSSHSSSRMKHASQSLQKIKTDLSSVDNADLEEMISEMKDPLCTQDGKMPAPLSAIFTPKITEHAGNTHRSAPRYLGFGPPGTNGLNSAASSSSSNTRAKTTPAFPVPPGVRRGPRLSESDSDDESTGMNKSTPVPPPQLTPPAAQHQSQPPPPQPEAAKVPPSAAPVEAKTKHADARSSSDSSSESSSSEEEDSNKSSSEEEEDGAKENPQEDFSLGNWLGKVRSTHSPGPNPHPSPRIQTKLPSEEDDNGGLSQPSPLPDLPDDPSLGHLRNGSPALDMISSVSSGKSRRKVNSTRGSTQSRQSNTYLEDSSDEEDFQKQPPVPQKQKRVRKPKAAAITSNNKKQEAKSNPRKPSTKVPKVSKLPKIPKVTKGSKAPTNAPKSRAYLSSEDSSDSDDVKPPKTIKELPKNVTPRAQQPNANSKADNSSPEDKGNNKKMFLSRIFMGKSKPNSTGGKGGKGGKSGVTVERVVSRTEDKDYPPPKRRLDGRPSILVQLPLELLRCRGVDTTRIRKRHLSGESVSSKHSTSSRKSSKSSKRSRHGSESVPPSKRAKTEVANNQPVKRDSKASSSDNKVVPDTWAASKGSNLMPPPNKMYQSYMEQRREGDEDESEEDFSSYMSEAKKMKHDADKETDRERQAMKYLQAVLYFLLCGNLQETRGDKNPAFLIYKETLSLIKHVCRPFRNSEYGNFDNKLAVLSLRCQSLINLKLYKMSRHELKECQKIIGDHIQKANQQSSPVPSPAGSEGSVCSKSSGYTSAGEAGQGANRLVMTSPSNSSNSAATQCLSVPQSVMQKQHLFCNFLSQSHELWEMADVYAQRGHCEDFIIKLDQTCGALTLHSSLRDLVKYTQTGLDYLA